MNTIYAINKRTKDHLRLSGNYDVCAPKGGEWRIVEADADGWILWGGGECPLPWDEAVEVKTGGEVQDAAACGFNWTRTHGLGTVSAYRPILNDDQDEHEAPEWNGEGLPPVGCECYISENGECAPVTVVAHHNGGVVVRVKGLHRSTAYKHRWADGVFRFRSAEDRAVEEMFKEAQLAGCVNFTYGMARALYRAGYRKVK